MSPSSIPTPTLPFPPSVLSALHALLSTPTTSASLPLLLPTLPRTLLLRPSILRPSTLFSISQPHESLNLCPLHKILSPTPFQDLTALITAELHPHSRVLLAAPAAILSPSTVIILATLRRWRAIFRADDDVAANGHGPGCLACRLNALWIDSDAVAALGVLCRGRKMKGREWPNLLGWLPTWVGEGKVEEVKDVMRFRRAMKRAGVTSEKLRSCGDEKDVTIGREQQEMTMENPFADTRQERGGEKAKQDYEIRNPFDGGSECESEEEEVEDEWRMGAAERADQYMGLLGKGNQERVRKSRGQELAEPQDLYKGCSELVAGRIEALDWARHDGDVHEKVTQWFSIIGKELHNPAIVPENVYKMDEMGVLLSVLSSLKVLVGREDAVNCKGAAVTAIEKAFANRAILLDKNKLLFEQNNEKTIQSSIRSTVTGRAKVMTHDDIVKAQRKRDDKEATVRGAKTAGRKGQNLGSGRSRVEELEHGMREIKALGLEGRSIVQYCNFVT